MRQSGGIPILNLTACPVSAALRGGAFCLKPFCFNGVTGRRESEVQLGSHPSRKSCRGAAGTHQGLNFGQVQPELAHLPSGLGAENLQDKGERGSAPGRAGRLPGARRGAAGEGRFLQVALRGRGKPGLGQ